MAIELIDQVARDDLELHETAPDPHAGQYVAVDGSTVLTALRLQSPNGTVWELTADDNGILHTTEVVP